MAAWSPAPRLTPRQARSDSRFGRQIGKPADFGPGGWWVSGEPQLHLGGHDLVPDLAGWRRSRLSALPTTAWFELAPDLLSDILSPATARLDRTEKLPLHAGLGWPLPGWSPPICACWRLSATRVAAGCSWAPSRGMP